MKIVMIMQEVNIGLGRCVLEMSVSFMDRCNGNVESVKGCGEL